MNAGFRAAALERRAKAVRQNRRSPVQSAEVGTIPNSLISGFWAGAGDRIQWHGASNAVSGLVCIPIGFPLGAPDLAKCLDLSRVGWLLQPRFRILQKLRQDCVVIGRRQDDPGRKAIIWNAIRSRSGTQRLEDSTDHRPTRLLNPKFGGGLWGGLKSTMYHIPRTSSQALRPCDNMDALLSQHDPRA